MSMPQTATQPTRQNTAMHWISKLGPAIGLIAVWCLFAALKGSGFTAWSNHRLMLLQTAVVATAAIGGTLVIIAGGIDLSVGSAIACGTMVLALLLQAGVPAVLAVLLSVLTGFAIGIAIGSMITGRVLTVASIGLGVFIGYVVSGRVPFPVAVLVSFGSAVTLGLLAYRFSPKIELSPFIVTLGLWGALRGVAKGLGDNQPIYPDQTWITDLMRTGNEGLFQILAPGAWLMLLLAVVVAGILRYTQFGRHVYAVGSNQETARLCGVHVERTKLLVYGLASALAAVAAVLQFAYINGTGDPTTAEGYELKVIASVVIGGASLSGGEGTILGTILGALIMTVVDNGCTKLGLDNWVQEIVTGAIIVAAVALDRLRQSFK